MVLKFKILLILLLGFAFNSDAQNPMPYGQPKQITWHKGGVWIDSIIKLPIRDTVNWTFLDFQKFGRLTVRPQDSLAYFHNGEKWIYAFGNGSSGGGACLDCITTSNFIVSEFVSGAINGSNTTFTITYSPVIGTGSLKRNGIEQRAGLGYDYTISGNTITTIFVPQTGETISYTYIKQ